MFLHLKEICRGYKVGNRYMQCFYIYKKYVIVVIINFSLTYHRTNKMCLDCDHLDSNWADYNDSKILDVKLVTMTGRQRLDFSSKWKPIIGFVGSITSKISSSTLINSRSQVGRKRLGVWCFFGNLRAAGGL